ncbi:MAG: prolipoprotein diacylglyceryl transferase [candidate division WOR-3 bacterium]
MYRYLFVIKEFKIPAYGFMAVIGYLVGMFFITKEGKERKIEPSVLQSLSIWIIVGMLIGARIWYVWENWCDFSSDFISIFKLWEGGMVFYGGFIGGFIGGLLFVKISKLNLPETMDVMAPGVAIAISIGRIGCFLNGCCYGRITNSWIGVSFPSRWLPPAYWDQVQKGLIPSTAECSLPVIPTQLISTLNLFIIFLILWKIRKKKIFNGFLFSLFIGLYGLHRFVIDFFRSYSGKALVLKFITLSQLLSIIMILISIVVITVNGVNKRKK